MNQNVIPQSLIYNPQFTQRLSDLLRRVEGVEETLKIYNEQIVSQDQMPCYPCSEKLKTHYLCTKMSSREIF